MLAEDDSLVDVLWVLTTGGAVSVASMCNIMLLMSYSNDSDAGIMFLVLLLSIFMRWIKVVDLFGAFKIFVYFFSLLKIPK